MKPKIATVFVTTNADTVGNSNRLKFLDFFSQCFNLIIYTNKPEFVGRLIPGAKVKSMEDKLARKIILHALAWRSIAASINSENVDAVFLNHDNAILAMWLKPPVFQYTRQMHDLVGLNNKRSILQYLYDKISEQVALNGLRKAVVNFAVSTPILEYLSKKKVPNLVLTPHGVKLQLYENPLKTDFHLDIARLKEKGYFVVSYTGWVSEQRGLWLMLDSIKKSVLKDHKIALVIAGCEEKYLNIIHGYARENKLEDNIIVYGRIDYTLVPGILHLSDLCLSFLEVNPAYQMSPPQKVIEYFAAGKPVLANKIKTHELLITDRLNGFILDENACEIAAAIIKLKNDRAMLAELSANALETAKKYDFDKIYGEMVSQIKSHIGKDEIT